MMTRYGICPVCGSHIAEHRHDSNWVLCECGWFGSNQTQKFERETQKRAITYMLSISIFIVLGFFHSTQWGNDSFSVLPLQAKSVLSIADSASLLAYAEMSIEHRHYEKGEALLSKWAEKENSAEAWEKLALLRSQMKEYHAAVLAFDKYHQAEGNNPLTLFQYAKVLQELEREDLAEKIYIHIVGLDPETYQRTVVEELVRLLINQQRFEDAQSILAQLSKPNMELPSHLIRQKEFVEQLLQDKTKTVKSAAL